MATVEPYPDTLHKPITTFNDIDLSLTYSYAHYLNWFFDERVELIGGKVFKMSPASSRMHQEISVNILNPIANFLKHKHCKVYVAPFDVRFLKAGKADHEVITVLQPDLCVVCDHAKLDDRGCIGAPDLVV